MAIIKLISDFDGVWTNQETEAGYVWDFIVNEISVLTKDKPEIINSLMLECKKEMDRAPYDFAWYSNGGISCYYQEDPFGDNNAIFDYINRAGSNKSYSKFKQHLALIKNKIESLKKGTLADFSNNCFVKSTTQFKLEGKLKPVDTAGEIIKKLNSSGVEIIVVSNSKTEKIEHLFRKAGHTVTNEKSIRRGKLHAIGDAKKFIIDNSFTAVPEFLEITSRFKPCLRRKNYYNILIEEKPDFVIGDVFSLDLALPLYLRMNDGNMKNLKVIQRIHPHTPGWVKEYLAKEEFKGIAFTVNSINELPELLGSSV